MGSTRLTAFWERAENKERGSEMKNLELGFVIAYIPSGLKAVTNFCDLPSSNIKRAALSTLWVWPVSGCLVWNTLR